MTDWRDVFALGVAPQLDDRMLEALARGLAENDPALLQAETTQPRFADEAECRGACAIAYAAWRGGGLTRVGEVSQFFYHVVYSGKLMNDLWKFMAWYDIEPRREVFPALLAEVRAEQARRANNNEGTSCPQ
jgi:hypothetical protein